MRKRLGRVGPFRIAMQVVGSQCEEPEMTQHKSDRAELEARIAEADRIASEGIGRSQRGDRLQVTVHEGDDVAEAMEKALAEHIAAHPEDAGRTVKDFRWIVHELVSPSRNPILAVALAFEERRKTGGGKLH